jgi:pyruvate/2-oxoglutarate dehydrogenase complex dihydrolipoamide acyltransferase (E2) component
MATRATTVQISMPQMGESVTEGTVLGWLKQVGDRVEADEPLVEVSTDKVDAEVPAPASGTLIKILAEPDSTVEVGAILGEIEVDGANGAAPAAEEPPEAEAPADEGAEAPTEADAPAEEAPPEPADAELVDVLFPEMGDSVAEGTVLEWRVAVGDTVAVDDPLVEISTDKVDADMPSPVAGTIAEILVEPDTTVAVGTVLLRIAAGAGAPAKATEP